MNIVIVGAGGFGREVLNLASSLGIKVIGFLSDNGFSEKSIANQVKILGNIEEHTVNSSANYYCCVGSPILKKKLVQRMEDNKLKIGSTLVASTADVGLFNTIGVGTIICQKSIITTNCNIGHFVNINLGCTIGHDTVIEDYVNLSPGVHLSGNTYLEEQVDIGSGAVVIPGVRIGKKTVIGAGAVVTKNIESHSLAVGIPAKVIKRDL